VAQIIQPWHVLLAGLVTPDALLAWHRSLVAGKWDHSKTPRGPGRPVVMKEIETLIVRFARESPNWGYRRVEGALANLGHTVARTTVANILKPNDIDPAPERGKKRRGVHFSVPIGPPSPPSSCADVTFTSPELASSARNGSA
jgi:hypothetical protein